MMEQNMNMGGMHEEKKSTGPMVGIIIVVVVLLAGAVFAFRDSKESTLQPVPIEEQPVIKEELSADATTSELSVQGSSSDIAEIEADMKATNLSGLDAGFVEMSDSL